MLRVAWMVPLPGWSGACRPGSEPLGSRCHPVCNVWALAWMAVRRACWAGCPAHVGFKFAVAVRTVGGVSFRLFGWRQPSVVEVWVVHVHAGEVVQDGRG